MTTRIPSSVQTAMCNVAADAVDAGGAGGTISVYTGAQPATANDAVAGTLLVAFTLPLPAYGDADANGVATLAGVPITGTAVYTGDAGWFRITDSTGATVRDGSVGDGQLTLSSASIVDGGDVQILSGTLTMPATAA